MVAYSCDLTTGTSELTVISPARCDSEGEAVSNLIQCTTEARFLAPSEINKWYALATMSRHERLVAQQLENQAINTFLPTFTEIHRWSDRRKQVELPLFPGYLFVHAVLSSSVRRSVLFARGAAGFVTMGGEPLPVQDEQIEDVQKLVASKLQFQAHPFLKVGQRVRIRGGSLDGVEGILVRCNGGNRLVISIDAISRSVALRIEGYDIQPI